jgi:hypothetical protein
MAEESIFAAGIQSLHAMGFFNILLPFMLVFTIVYGVLERSKFFGENRHDINAVIGLVLGLMVVISAFVLQVLTDFLPLIGLFAVVLVCFMLLISMFWGEAQNIFDNKWIKYSAVVVIAGVIVFVLADLLGFGDLFVGATSGDKILGIFAPVDIAALAFMVFFGLILIWVAKPKGGS